MLNLPTGRFFCPEGNTRSHSIESACSFCRARVPVLWHKKASPKGGFFRVLSNKINALYQRRKTQLLLFVLLMQPRGVMLAHGRESDAGFRLEDFGAKHRAPMRGSVRFAVILRVRGDDAGNLIRLFSE